MSDIVERLRAPQQGWKPAEIAAGQVCVDAALLEEAAKEIESLRTLLETEDV